MDCPSIDIESSGLQGSGSRRHNDVGLRGIDAFLYRRLRILTKHGRCFDPPIQRPKAERTPAMEGPVEGPEHPRTPTAIRIENAAISDGCPRQARLYAKGALIGDFILEDTRLRDQQVRGDGGLAPQNTIANAAAGADKMWIQPPG